ncbi:Hypothetical predicted protein [Olea europaea subsp. europaea]|uniref:Uncharacterized protein n=1 Tax=Olea europaea subsp. europaea TaxID=158383 RepID=A0A8S0UFE7_OLEEU|nr:Hypothetical predicted protein [Olea europaea subsp. europaea]
MDQLSPALSILYNSEKVRILDERYDEIFLLGIKIMPDLRYLDVPFLDSAISRLQNLEVLRVGVESIPAYLLSMPKLRHLYVGTFEKYATFSKNCDFGTSITPANFSKNCDCSRINSLQTLFHVLIGDSKDEEILSLTQFFYFHDFLFSSVRLLKLAWKLREEVEIPERSLLEFGPPDLRKPLHQFLQQVGKMAVLGISESFKTIILRVDEVITRAPRQREDRM